jgi:hypothetical protein
MKRITLTSTVMVVFLALLGPAPVGRAGEPPGPEALARRYAQLQREGASGATMKAMFDQEFGLRLRSAAPMASGSSSPGPGDVILDKPSVAGGEGDSPYVLVGSMRWNDCSGRGCWEKDRGSNDAGDHGGPDGFAIHTQRPIIRRNASMFRTNSCGHRENADQPSTKNEYGVGFKLQDESRGFCWNWKQATIVVQFDFMDGGGFCNGKLYSVETEFTHTWDTTSLTSIGISQTGIQFSWNDTPHHYEVLPSKPWVSDTDGGCT